MEFCPVCKFMVYTKLNKNTSPHSLSHYCKNCHWEKEITDLQGPVYKRNSEEDHIAEKALTNKYTIFDVTDYNDVEFTQHHNDDHHADHEMEPSI